MLAYKILKHIPGVLYLSAMGGPLSQLKAFRLVIPICSGDEEDTCQCVGYPDLDPFLPARLESTNRKATYSWNVSLEKTMREEGIDFRPPPVRSSWFWVMDNSQFGSDTESMPKGDA